jgi:hypothetical protein
MYTANVRIKGRKQLARRIGQIDRDEETLDHLESKRPTPKAQCNLQPDKIDCGP